MGIGVRTVRYLAYLISLIGNPLVFLFLVPYLIVFKQTGSTFAAVRWQLFTTFFLLATILFFLVGKHRGFFSDSDISKREERPRFYLFIFVLSILYFGTALFFKGIFFPISIVAFGICVAIVAFAIVNYRLKASGHVAVASAFILTVSSLYGIQILLWTLWIVPLVAWSRIVLKRHTLREVIVGGLLGTAITLSVLLLGRTVYEFK